MVLCSMAVSCQHGGRHNPLFLFTFTAKVCIVPLMSPLQYLCRDVIKMIISDVTHSPDGYTYWFHLPPSGVYSRHAMQRRWIATVIKYILPDTLINAMTLASLSPDGLPHKEGAALRQWLLTYVYSKDVAELYKKWATLHITLKQ